jgi:hypothetical protein
MDMMRSQPVTALWMTVSWNIKTGNVRRAGTESENICKHNIDCCEELWESRNMRNDNKWNDKDKLTKTTFILFDFFLKENFIIEFSSETFSVVDDYIISIKRSAFASHLLNLLLKCTNVQSFFLFCFFQDIIQLSKHPCRFLFSETV